MFFWVVLVIRQLRVASDHGNSLKEIRELVDQLPPELYSLFAQIVGKLKPKQRQTGLNIVHWVLGAFGPRYPENLYIALRFLEEPPTTSMSDISTDGYGHSGYDLNRFRRYLIENTCGLFEIVETSHTFPYVQYIHESVRDFLESPAGLEAYGFMSKEDSVRARIGVIFQCLLNYSRLREIRAVFEPSGALKFASIQQLVDFVQGKRLQREMRLRFRLSVYLYDHDFKHLRNFLSLISTQFGATSRLDAVIRARSFLEGCVYIYCSYIEPRVTRFVNSTLILSMKELTNVELDTLALSTSENERLVRSLENHLLFCNSFGIWDMRLWKPNATYVQVYWVQAPNRPSASSAAKQLEKSRSTETAGDKGPLTPQQACELCTEHATDFRFVVTFCTM